MGRRDNLRKRGKKSKICFLPAINEIPREQGAGNGLVSRRVCVSVQHDSLAVYHTGLRRDKERGSQESTLVQYAKRTKHTERRKYLRAN